ncbi:hypothetical protein ACLKA7_003169 [Drosophila subpalustris]
MPSIKCEIRFHHEQRCKSAKEILEEISTGEPSPTIPKRPAEGSRQKPQLLRRPSVFCFIDRQIQKLPGFLFHSAAKSGRNSPFWIHLMLTANTCTRNLPASGISFSLID